MYTLTAPVQPPLLTDVFEQAFGLYRRRFLTIFVIVSLLQIPIVALHLWLALTLGKGLPDDSVALISMLFRPTEGQISPTSIINYFAASMVVALIQTMLCNQFVAGIFTHALVLQHQHQPVTVAHVLHIGLRRTLALFAAGCIATGASLGIAGIGFALVWLARNTLSYGTFQDATRSGLELFVILTVTLVLLVLFFIKLLFFPQAIVVEQVSAWDGLRRSWSLTSGALWRVFGSAALVWMLLLIATGIPTACINFAVQFMYPRPAEDLLVRQVVSLFVNDLFTIVALPLQISAYCMLYFDLRRRREGHAERFE